MTQTTDVSVQSALPLPDVFSSALTALFETVRPGIVQIHNAQRGGGTGIVWQNDGRILTNNHVVPSDQDQIQVHFNDGRTFEARVLQRNPELDLALLKITGDAFHALTLGDSTQLRVGEWVFAIGHPWGQRWAVTAGIVSAMRPVARDQAKSTQYIQSDVLLAPGNSGGPLLDADGNVVGINAMIFGGDLSVAIPSSVVTSWLANLPKGRKALGIEIQRVDLSATTQQQEAIQQTTGLLVVSTKGRPETYVDLLIGDILLAVAGKSVPDGATLRAALTQGSIGETLPVTLLRGGNVITVDIAVLTLDNAS